MTIEGQNWVVNIATENAYPGRLDTAHALSSASADFWLSAFTKLIESEAKRRCDSIHEFSGNAPCMLCVDAAFNSICERFGI